MDLCRLRQRCAELTDNTDHRETLLAAEKLFEESTLQKNELYEAYGLYYIGISHLLLGRAEEGHKNLNRAMEIAERIENDTLKVNIYNSFGIYEANKNNHILATDYFYKALEHALRLDDELRRSKIEINLAHMFQIRKDTTGYKYTADAYSWGKKHGNHNLTICAGYYCAYFRHLQGRNDEAKMILDEAASLAEKHGFKDMAALYQLYGYIHEASGDYQQSLAALRKALSLQHDAQAATVPEIYLAMAQVLAKQGNHRESNALIDSGEKLALTNNVHQVLNDFYLLKSQNYEALGDNDSAFAFYKAHTAITDSLYHSEKERAIKELSVKYDVQSREKDLDHHKQMLAKETQKTTILVIFLSCLVVLAAILAVMYRKQRSLYIAIAKQNRTAMLRREALIMSLKEDHPESADSPVESSGGNPSPAASMPDGNDTDGAMGDEEQAKLFSRICRLMEEGHIFTDKTLTRDSLAKRLGTNRTYLSTAINKNAGVTFSQFINSYRIQEALRMLSDPQNMDYPLKAISDDLGFNSMTTFYKQFQSEVGMTPAAYRKTVQKL